MTTTPDTPDTLAKLAACPFCGGQPKKKTDSLDERYSYANRVTYECTGCGCRRGAMGDASKPGYADNSTTEQRALDAWNRRALTAQALPAAEPVTRFCPGCGYVGEVEAKYRDCCPDGSGARMIPESLARKCHDLFALAIQSACTTPQAAQQAAQATAGWVSVADRLPPPFENVVVHPRPTEYCCEAQVNTQGAWQYHEYEHNFGVNHFKCEVTHWWSSPPPAALPQPQPQSAQSKGDAA